MPGKHAKPKNKWGRRAAVSATAATVAVGVPVASAEAATPETTQSIPKMTKQQIAVQYAVSKIGLGPYLWGGNGPTRFDCSGLTSQAWKAAGVAIPRTSQSQLAGLPRVSRADIQPGDLVVFSFSSHADHVGIYTGPIGPGGADMIDTASSHPGGGVGWNRLATRGPLAGVVRPAPVTAAPKPAPTAPTAPTAPVKPSPSLTYEVKEGDTLSEIARTFRVEGGWKALWSLNRDKVGDPDLIFPGQVLRLR